MLPRVVSCALVALAIGLGVSTVTAQPSAAQVKKDLSGTKTLSVTVHGRGTRVWSKGYTTDKCYANSGLKDSHEIVYSVSGKTVTGEFRVARDFDAANAEIYPFKGTITGVDVSVRFTGESPDALPVSPATKRWTIVTGGLQVTLYGKNYNTNRWGNYTVVYKACASPYDLAVRSAKRVTFAKGTTSASYELAFKAKDERQSFLLNLRAGQAASATAPGCGISFFYPDKKPYEEGTAIDTWGSESLPQSGEYLFVISPAGEPGRCSLAFTAK